MNNATIYEFHIIKIKFNINIVFFINQSKKLYFILNFKIKKILKNKYIIDLFVEN